MSQNFSITGGVANNLAIVCGPSERTSDLLCIISVSGVAVVSKKSDASGGSADEIGVSLGANPSTDNNTYTVKLTEADVSQLPSSGASYKLYDISAEPETEIETGTIAVSSAEAAPTATVYEVRRYCVKATVTESGPLGVNMPAGALVKELYFEKQTSGDIGYVNIGYSEEAIDIVDSLYIKQGQALILAGAGGLVSEPDGGSGYTNNTKYIDEAAIVPKADIGDIHITYPPAAVGEFNLWIIYEVQK